MYGRAGNGMQYGRSWLLGLALLTACGSGGGRAGDTAPVSHGAAAVHTAWLTALRTNDRDQALALFAAGSFKEAQVHAALSMMQQYMFSQTTEGPYATGGLREVRAVKLDARGGGMAAWSRWIYAKQTNCHRTDLAQTQAGWRVTDYTLTNPGECPS